MTYTARAEIRDFLHLPSAFCSNFSCSGLLGELIYAYILYIYLEILAKNIKIYNLRLVIIFDSYI